MRSFRIWLDDASNVAKAGLVVTVVATLIAAAAFANDVVHGDPGPTASPAPPLSSAGPLPADPAQWHDRTVRIGINGKLPGWSGPAATGYAGFDIALSSYLADRYHFKIDWKLLNQADRSAQWPCNGQPGASNPADLVISAFSITPSRVACFPMAGPYYRDVNTLWRNANKPQVSSDGKEHGCAILGTTGWEKMDAYRKGKTNFELTGDSELASCVGSFFDPSNPISLISSDWSILRAFNSTVQVTDLAGALVYDPDPPVSSEDEERYGVALSPELRPACAALAATIDQFLTDEWKLQANQQLEPRMVQPGRYNWHKPAGADLSNCAQPGNVVAGPASAAPGAS